MLLALIVVLGLGCRQMMADTVEVYPRPQQLKVTGPEVSLTLPFRTAGLDGASAQVLRLLLEDIGVGGGSQATRLLVGTREDKEMRSFRRRIPEKPEGYYLRVDADEVVVAGYDQRGLFYGLQTLRQLLGQKSAAAGDTCRIPAVEVTDWPDVAVRGVVEGFYGTPWSHEARMRLIDFWGKYKMNTYIYGPKNDRYHSSPNWRKPYPAAEAAGIRELVKHAHEMEVDFVWAVHPGRDIRWTEEDRNQLMAKLESMYGLGVRAFAVFFDDISGAGTDPARQVELLNDVNRNFVKAKGDVKPLIMCPSEYNRGRRKVETRYLETLGEGLDADIRIMWTGDRALSDITAENLSWVQTLIRRKPYIWWNFPVSDFSNDRVLMGEVYGVDSSIRTETSGFVSNPMEYAEASRLALFSVADYTWKTSGYNSLESWKAGARALMPDAAEAFHCFCTHAAATGEGHYPRRESENIRQPAERMLKQMQESRSWQEADKEALRAEFERMKAAADQLALSTANPELSAELGPWFTAFDYWAQLGLEALRLAEDIKAGNRAACEARIAHMQTLQTRLSRISRRPGAGMATLGTAVIQPFVKGMMKVPLP